MTFLKKLGQLLFQVVGIITGVGPLLVPFLGSGKAAQAVSTGINDLTAMGQRVVEIETAVQTPGSGPQKLAMVIPLITNIVRTSEMVIGHKVANDALFAKACQEYAQATVDLLNSLHPESIKTQ